ncbi:dispersed gene family protein 1 (DGF-1) [Trypanosoma cruzi]|uniref:Dispersed gene family protein 1 (DGF-1), putative n=2 Tax=Trypanosoma cruzi TaxID=5693 RepID=Q4E291_TRYCC|nr:dispersed gene family protein 1 (DGF-1), putative [Trypanosoma cruzi]EAN98885.1 dispersed gene family protein 1 (DGF-1), putative [Trypanosoma cruzi]PWV05538.1 dispersed gene family protein 1 (DGF-1) [Trypanosoma cruzi]|eukprot:XP_820736.1 dispersed gene family protein 1 (DGF-1) [Trypanosoma cruzi strain CL Brener]
MVDGAGATHHDGPVGTCLGRWMRSAVGACPRGRHRVRRRAIAAVRVALLVVLALVAAAWMPAVHAVVLRLRGGTVDRAITVGRAVDTVLMDGVSITNGVAVVFDVAAMLSGALRIELRNCVCDGGAQIYVWGYSGEPASDRSLEVSVSGLSGEYCSLVFVHNLPAHTNVTVRDSTIVTAGPMRHSQLSGLTDAVASPLLLHATSLLQSQLRVSNTVLRSLHAGGSAVHVGGDVDLLSSAVVLDGVSLEASGGPTASALHVSSSTRLSLRSHSVFSVTNVSVVSSGGGIVLGERLAVFDSVLRFVGVEGSVASSLVRCGGGTIGAGGWLELRDVWAVGEASSVASLSGVTLGGGAVSIARCAATGATLVSGSTITSGAVSVQCNRAGGRVLRSSGDYRLAGLPSVSVVPCDGCAAALACFDALTASFNDCVCGCRAGGVGESCLPFDVPPARAGGGGGGSQGCLSGVTLTESVTVGGGRATACFDSVVFSGPITVAVDLRLMDAFDNALNVTLRHCVLSGGAQLRIGGLSESTARLMPHAIVNMTNVTSLEGTIVLHGAMPLHSSVLLANSTLRATVGGSQYVPTTRGHAKSRHGPALVLDGVRLLSTRFVMTRSTLVCGGGSCAAMLVERGLGVNLSSVFYMDNCAVNSQMHVMYALASDLRVSGGSVFSIQNCSWSAPSTEYGKGACVFKDVVVDSGSVLQIVSSTFRLGFAMLMANTLTVTGGSWLVYRNNEFRTAHVVYVAKENGVAFRDQSVWSILENNFTYGSFSSFTYMTSNWSPPSDTRPIIYGVCNEARGSTVTNYQEELNIGAPVTVLDCGACTVGSVCFAARTSSISGRECVCASGGYGDTCLPAAAPDGLGPLPLPDAKNTEVRCVHGGSIDSLDVPDPGVRGLCFVNVTFTAAIVLDLSYFDAPQQTLNITLLQCVLMGLSIRGSGARVHVNVTSSMLDSGELEFRGVFGVSSQILVVGSTIVTTSGHAILFVEFTLSANMTLLLLDNYVEASRYAVYLSDSVVVDGGGIIVKGNTLSTAEDDEGVESSVCVYAVDVRNGGYFDMENNTMSAVNGVILFGDTTVRSAGLLRVADCTFVGGTEIFDSALVYLSGSVTLEGGAQWRVEGNGVGAASVLNIPYSWQKIQLSGSGTTVALAHNRQVEGNALFAKLFKSNTIVESPARFVVGCNLQGDEEVPYDYVFPEEVVLFRCGTCNEDAACYMPGTESVDRSSCSCSCKDGWHGASCLPLEVPDTVVPPVAERAVDGDTSCVVNQTLTNLTLKMWRTHHCYVDVTFSGVGAVLTFFLNSMPLHLPVNITLTGCTFREGAALQFFGGAEAAESSGVLIRVSQTVMRSSAVAFINALPQHCEIAVTEVDAVQTFEFELPGVVSKTLSVFLLGNVVLSASTLLVSNVKAHATNRDAFVLYSTGTLKLVGGSSLYVRYCSFEGYTHVFYVYRLSVSDHSVFALLNNTMFSGVSLLYQHQGFSVSDHSVLRVVGNSGSVRYAICNDVLWTVQQSSWLDWRDNDVEVGAMFYDTESAFVTIDSSSAVTLTGCKMGSTGLSVSLLKRADAGYRFVAGCLKVAGRLVTTAAELELNGINNVTTVAACGQCTKESDCFAPLTTAVIGCECQCAAGGHGDVCVPAPVPAGPPPPPPPPPVPPTPLPPPVGECISDMVYPEVAQTVGDGLSWLCYRNVTFSGGGMRLTVLVGAMTGDVANVTFYGCTWRDGAVLLLLGNAYAAVGSLNIVVTGNTFTDALLSPEGVFPPHTNITISGNRFTATRLIPRSGLGLRRPSCVAMNELAISNDSAVVFSGNVFQSVTASSSAIHVFGSALRVSWHSVFAVVGNTFHMAGGDSTLIYLEGSSQSSSLKVLNNSAVVIRGNVVSRPVRYFLLVILALRVESRSAVVFQGNDIQGSSVVFFPVFSSYIYYNSWLQLSGNLCRVSPSEALIVFDPTVHLRDSTVSLSGNRLMSSTVTPIILQVPTASRDITNGAIVAACNTVNGEEGVEYSIPSVYNTTILSCSDPCTLATSCFPAYTTAASSDGCACTCAEGGHGDACLPVAAPEPPSTDGADLCVRDVRVDGVLNAGLGTSVVCYVGVTLAADVVVDVESMSGSVRNVTLANCTFLGGASLYVVGWRSDPSAGERADVLISGLESCSGGGVVVANRFPPGSRVTVVDSVLIAEARVAYRGAYDLGDASACLVLHKVNMTGSVLTIARTHVAAVFRDAVGVLLVGGVPLHSRGALHVDGLSVQTALGLCVSVEGGVAASGGSVVAFVDSEFLLCKNAVSVRGAVSVSGSIVALVRNEFLSTEDYAVAIYSTVSLDGGSMLLAKDNVHDGVSREMLYAAGAVTAAGSTLSFVRNRALLPRMLSLSLSLAAGAHLRVACNYAGGRVLSTAEEYAAAGFGDAGSIDVAGCDACDRDTHCYAPGTASASMRNGVCVCACGSGEYGEACVPVGAPALPPAAGTASSVFVREGMTVRSVFVVPAGASEVTLRHVVLDGVSPVLYVPWMALDGVRIVVQNVSLRNGAVLYVMGGGALRDARAAGSDESGPVELSVCDVEALNGALVLSGTFSAGSVLTVTDSLLVAARSTPLVYLLGSRSSPYAPVLVLSGLRLVRSVLVVFGVFLVTVVTGGRTVVVDGAVLELFGGGVALDAAVFGGDVALYASARVVASGGAVLRVLGSQVYAAHGLVFDSGVEANASAVVVNDNAGALTDGALLVLRGSALFVSGSWLSVRGNSISGRLLSLPSYPRGADLVQSTLTLHGNAGSGPVVMDGTVALVGAGRRFVVGCLTLNGQALRPMDYRSAGIIGEFRPVACGVCDADVHCFAAATRAMSGSCRCRCAEGGYGRDCLPVYLPHVDGCNRTPAMPPLSHMATLTETRSPTPKWTATPTPTHCSLTQYSQTETLQMTETVALPTATMTASGSLSSTVWWSDVACPTLAVTTTAAGGSLTQNDIRGGGSAVPTLLMVTLPPPFRWARDPQLGKHLSLVPVSTAQPSGFGGPWGAMLRNATWVRNATNPSTVLELAVPVHRGYFIAADETIVIRCDAVAVSGGCKGVLLGSFTIRSNTLPVAASALSAITGVVAGATAVAVVVTGGLGSILEMQALGVFARMSCASAQERASTVALPYFLSVFAALGPLWMVVGNALLAAVFGCVHCGVTAAFQRWRGVDAASAWAAMRFPSLTYVVAHAMHLGIFFGSVLALAMSDARVQHRVIGVAGVLYGVAFPAGVCYFIARHVGASFTKYWQFSRKPLHERLLYPVGYWCPAAQQRMYGGMLTNMRGSYLYWCVFQPSVLCVVCLIAAVHPSAEGCHVQYFCMAAVLLAGAGVVAFTNMMRSAFLTVMHAASLVLLAALCLVSAANHLAPSDGGARAYAAIVLLLITVLLAVTVYSVVVWYAEDRHWQELREPRRGGLEALLRDDEESDEETQKPHEMKSSSYAIGATVASSYRPPAPPLQPMAGDIRSDAMSLLDRASSASPMIDYAAM